MFKRTLPYTTRLTSAPLIHLRAPLASIRKSHALSVAATRVCMISIWLRLWLCCGGDDEEMGPEVHDNRLAQAFSKTLFGHLKGNGKETDMAVYRGGWLKLCGVSRCAYLLRLVSSRARAN
uniref:Uncharacterized protein n=1 Tax=Peronospora matthiolae TaxID=2874970 RepID=A0AAV1TV16_9STRA